MLKKMLPITARRNHGTKHMSINQPLLLLSWSLLTVSEMFGMSINNPYIEENASNCLLVKKLLKAIPSNNEITIKYMCHHINSAREALPLKLKYFLKVV